MARKPKIGVNISLGGGVIISGQPHNVDTRLALFSSC